MQKYNLWSILWKWGIEQFSILPNQQLRPIAIVSQWTKHKLFLAEMAQCDSTSGTVRTFYFFQCGIIAFKCKSHEQFICAWFHSTFRVKDYMTRSDGKWNRENFLIRCLSHDDGRRSLRPQSSMNMNTVNVAHEVHHNGWIFLFTRVGWLKCRKVIRQFN